MLSRVHKSVGSAVIKRISPLNPLKHGSINFFTTIYVLSVTVIVEDVVIAVKIATSFPDLIKAVKWSFEIKR